MVHIHHPPDPAFHMVEINEADNFYNPVLRGINSASQGDVWFVTWDGNSTLIAGRPHPLGVAVESRGLGWNYPTGNEDIVYFTFAFYNVTASDPAAYSAVRPAIRPIMRCPTSSPPVCSVINVSGWRMSAR